MKNQRMEEKIIKKSEALKIKYKYSSTAQNIEGFENFFTGIEYINKYHHDDIETIEAIKIG